jgi:predicted membrane protein
MHRLKDYQGRIFVGFLIILIGILFLLGNLGHLDIGEVFARYWPFILIFIGLWQLVGSDFRNLGSGVILIVIGIFFMLLKWDVLGGKTWAILWPLLIIAVGLWLLFKPRFRQFKGEVPPVEEKDLDEFTLFSGLKRRFESKEFRGGKATALFGGMELDMTQAKLAEDKATIELTAIFGGIDLWVPDNWEIVIDSSAILGGVDDKHKTVSGVEKKEKLFIRATAIFGGIDIK